MLTYIQSLVTPDKFIIEGTVTLPDISSDRMVIFAHGLWEDQHHHLFVNGAQFMAQHNIASYRCNFYSTNHSSRPFLSATTSTQASDLQQINSYFAQHFSPIFVVAHSLGAIPALMTQGKHIAGIVLWDPSLHPKDIFTYTMFRSCNNCHTLSHGQETVIGERLIRDANSISNIPALTRTVMCPIAIIAADSSHAKLVKSTYYDNAVIPLGFRIIRDSNHNFDEPQSELELFDQTLRYILAIINEYAPIG